MSKGAASVVEVTPVAALYPAPPVVDGFVVESNVPQQAAMQASTDEAIARVIQADEDEATRRAVEAACVAQRQAISATWVSPAAPVHAVSQGRAGATCGCGSCHCRQRDAAAWVSPLTDLAPNLRPRPTTAAFSAGLLRLHRIRHWGGSVGVGLLLAR